MDIPSHITTRLENLEHLVGDLRRDVDALGHESPNSAAVENATPQAPAEAATVQAIVAPQTPAAYTPTITPASQAPISSRALEQLIGGRGLFFAGLALIALAMVYFLKLAFDQWIGPLGRIGFGVVAGAVLMTVAVRVGPKRLTYVAEGVLGLGAFIEYFTLYAATNLYHMLDPLSTYAAMTAVTAATAAVAYTWKSQRMAIFSAVGALCAPVWIGSTGVDRIALTAYTGIVDVVFLALAQRMNWRKLPLFLNVGSGIIIAACIINVSTLPLEMRGFISVAFYVLFLAAAKLRLNGEEQSLTDVVTEILNVLFVVSLLISIFADNSHKLEATLVLGGVAALQAFSSKLWTSRRLAFIPAAVAIQMSAGNHLEIPQFSLFALMLYAFSLRHRDSISQAAAFLLQGFVTLVALAQYSSFVSPHFLFNDRMLSYATLGAVYIAMSLTAKRSDLGKERDQNILFATLRLVGVAAFWAAFSCEALDFGNRLGTSNAAQIAQIMLSATWALFACGLVVNGFLEKLNYLRWAGLGLLLALFAKILTVDLATAELAYRIGSALVVGIFALIIAAQYQKRGKAA